VSAVRRTQRQTVVVGAGENENTRKVQMLLLATQRSMHAGGGLAWRSGETPHPQEGKA
jgi:hypothetical protein